MIENPSASRIVYNRALEQVQSEVAQHTGGQLALQPLPLAIHSSKE